MQYFAIPLYIPVYGTQVPNAPGYLSYRPPSFCSGPSVGRSPGAGALALFAAEFEAQQTALERGERYLRYPGALGTCVPFIWVLYKA